MIYTLQACVGLMLGLCGHYVHVEYQTMNDCFMAAESMRKNKDVTYAICVPGGKIK